MEIFIIVRQNILYVHCCQEIGFVSVICRMFDMLVVLSLFASHQKSRLIWSLQADMLNARLTGYTAGMQPFFTDTVVVPYALLTNILTSSQWMGPETTFSFVGDVWNQYVSYFFQINL